MTRSLPALALAVLAGLAACAPAHEAVSPRPGVTGPPQGRGVPGSGVIVSMRPIEATTGPPGTIAGTAGRSDIRGTILGAVGSGVVIGMAADASPAEPAATYEFITRLDDGQTISVVQTNTNALRPGERVLLTEGPRTRLSRVVSPATVPAAH